MSDVTKNQIVLLLKRVEKQLQQIHAKIDTTQHGKKGLVASLQAKIESQKWTIAGLRAWQTRRSRKKNKK